MTSNDNQHYVTIDIFRTTIGDLRTEILSGFSETRKENKELRTEIQSVKENTIVNSAKIDDYKDFTGIWFTVIAVIIGIVGLFAPLLRDIYKDAKQSKRINDMKEIAREVMREEIREAVRESMRASGVIGK